MKGLMHMLSIFSEHLSYFHSIFKKKKHSAKLFFSASSFVVLYAVKDKGKIYSAFALSYMLSLPCYVC